MMQTAAVQKISEQNSPYKAMLDRAYMIGYTDAMNQERSHRRAARERRERKKYFAMQKLNGVALLIFTAVAIKILEGDATIAFITVPFTKQFNAWFALEKKSMEQDHANFIEEYAEMTQAFMTDQEAQWNKWFKEKQPTVIRWGTR